MLQHFLAKGYVTCTFHTRCNVPVSYLWASSGALEHAFGACDVSHAEHQEPGLHVQHRGSSTSPHGNTLLWHTRHSVMLPNACSFAVVYRCHFIQ